MKLAVLALLMLSDIASAQAPAVPTNVTSVQSVGYWQHAGQSGTYRLITASEGWEHVRSRVFVEWVPEPASRNADQPPSQTIELHPPGAQGSSVIEASARRVGVGSIDIKLVVRSNQVVRAKARVYHFLATAPGVVQPSRAAAQ